MGGKSEGKIVQQNRERKEEGRQEEARVFRDGR